jgi:hypothetical protein
MSILSVFHGLTMRTFRREGSLYRVPRVRAVYGDITAAADLKGNILMGSLKPKVFLQHLRIATKTFTSKTRNAILM